MTSKTIPLTDLPALTTNIKMAICYLVWSIYETNEKITKKEPNAKYVLRSNIGDYLLFKDGNILRKLESNEKFQLDTQVYFEGFDLSNIKIDLSNLKDMKP